jgi:hypothetical protein
MAEAIKRLVHSALRGVGFADVTFDGEVVRLVGWRHRLGDADDGVPGLTVAGYEPGADSTGCAGDDRDLPRDVRPVHATRYVS